MTVGQWLAFYGKRNRNTFISLKKKKTRKKWSVFSPLNFVRQCRLFDDRFISWLLYVTCSSVRSNDILAPRTLLHLIWNPQTNNFKFSDWLGHNLIITISQFSWRYLPLIFFRLGGLFCISKIAEDEERAQRNLPQSSVVIITEEQQIVK